VTTPKSTAQKAQNSDAFRIVARVGYAVLGVIHIAIGIIAISIATGGGGEADQGGAMQQIREAPAGVFILWIVALALAALGVWQIAEAFLVQEGDDKKKWGYRVKFAATGVTYLAIAGTAVVFAMGGQSDSSESSTTLSAELLSTPGGVFLLVLIGLVVTGVGVAFIIRGITKAFKKNLELPAGKAAQGIVRFGQVGYIAKGIAVGVAGILFVVAAFTNDPEEAGGLDAALHTLAGLPFGPFILWIVGAGLVIYGLFCFARARYAKM
jgi:hypothetical protein